MSDSNKKDVLKRAFRPLEIFLIICICVVFVEVLAEVISRYIFNFSIAWGSELSQTLLVWIAFIGAAVAFLYDEHMAINILSNRITSATIRKVLEFICAVAIFAFLVISVIGGCDLVMRTWSMKTVTLQIPAGILYLAFPLGCFFMLIVNIRNMIRIFRR
jgi:TRAP-type C4-dicarboxylate transport system permease small subunit